MNTAVINSLPEKHTFDSKIKEVSESTCEGKISDKSEKIIKNITKEDPPALHILSETALKPTVSNSSCVTSTNVKTPARMVPLVYIQAPNLKVPSSMASTGNSKSNPQILVNANNQFQISTLSTKLKANTTMSSVVLTQTGTNNKSQPIILQKTTNNSNAQTLIPVTVATSTGTKQTFAYLGTIIKPPGAKTSENQIVVPTSHLPAGLVPAPTNQKLVLTSMAMPKLTPRVPITCSTTSNTQSKLSNLILPVSLGAQIKNAINVKISNGQIQSDPKGCISVLCDSKTTDNNNEPSKDKIDSVKETLDIEKKEAKPAKGNNVKTPTSTIAITTCEGKIDNKPLTEKEYELSIPEVPTSKCELSYTISIPDEKTKLYKPFITRTVTAEPVKDMVDDLLLGKVQSIVPKPEPQLQRKSLHEVSILKKCNLNAIDRKTVDSVSIKKPPTPEKSVDLKTDFTDLQPVKMEEKLQITPAVRKVNPERRRKSQYTYLRDFDEVVVTSGNAWENKNNVENNKLKHFQSTEITFTKLPAVDEETKENDVNSKKSVDDFIEIELVKQDLPQFCTEDDKDIRTVLKWRDGIGFLPGSKLKFHINEFGIIEMLVGDELDKFKSIKKEDEGVNGDEILCCSECGCYGMPSEFISENYCSKTCKLAAIKSESKRAYLQDVKAKRKKKKLALMKNHKSDELMKLADDSQQLLNPASDDDEHSNDMLPDNKILNYPWQAGKKGFSWSKYLDHVKSKAAPVKLFKDPFPYAKNGFRPGMKLEGIDPQHPSYFCVMTVSEVQGYRIRLHFDGYPENFDFWVNADSMNIFPVGWCEKYNHVLHPPPTYPPNEFSWTTYLKQCKATAAPRQLFAHRSGNSVCPNGFRLGMKLEAVDKKNASLVCVATVTDLMDNRFLVHFDSWDDIYDYWADPSSPYIHPVGWCDQFGHSLTPPNDYPNPECFTWEKYIKETKSVAAPVRAFKQRPGNGFKRDMRLECVDKRVPSLIRVATVEDVRDHQVRLRFDGWPNKYSFWIDDDSSDIHPPGWCQKTGHPLESPLTPEDVYESYDCPTVGCRGIGHIQGPKYLSHNTSKDCPYSDENLDAEFISPDRLTLTESDFIVKAVVPVSREPREKLKPNRMGRPTKIRRLTETNIKPEWLAEDDLSDSSRKRKISASREENMSSPLLKFQDENHRFKFLNDFPSCPSQQVLAKHSKILNEIISSNARDPRTWTQEEVADFVNSLPSCKEHSKLFITHKIDGEAFLMLTQRDLVDILKFKLGPAIKLYNSIVLLRQNVNFYN